MLNRNVYSTKLSTGIDFLNTRYPDFAGVQILIKQGASNLCRTSGARPSDTTDPHIPTPPSLNQVYHLPDLLDTLLPASNLPANNTVQSPLSVRTSLQRRFPLHLPLLRFSGSRRRRINRSE